MMQPPQKSILWVTAIPLILAFTLMPLAVIRVQARTQPPAPLDPAALAAFNE